GQFAAPRGLATTRTLRGLRSFLNTTRSRGKWFPSASLSLELVCPLPSGDRASKLHFSPPVVGPIFLSYRRAVRPHAFGWPALVPRSLLVVVATMGGAAHGRRGRAPKTPTLLDVLWVRGRLKLQNHECSLPRVLDSKLRVTASPTRVSLGVASCQSEILSLKKAVWRLWLVSKNKTKSSGKGVGQLLKRGAEVSRPPA